MTTTPTLSALQHLISSHHCRGELWSSGTGHTITLHAAQFDRLRVELCTPAGRLVVIDGSRYGSTSSSNDAFVDVDPAMPAGCARDVCRRCCAERRVALDL